MEIFAIKDEQVGWLNVLVDSNIEVAKFNFGKGFYSTNPEFGRLEDYSLYLVGHLDVDDGFIFEENPIFITNGLTAYNQFVSRLKCLNIEKLEVLENADTNISQENK